MAPVRQANDVTALGWGLKQSFRNYVESAGGRIETAAGAARSPDGAFTFTPGPGEGLKLGANGQLEGNGTFLGEVRCEAHGGMLKVFFADPSIEIGPTGATLVVAESPARDRRVELAQLDVAAATSEGADDVVIPTKLSKDGWRILGDHYSPMTPMDPVRLKLGRRS
jgi:hypothetical protein